MTDYHGTPTKPDPKPVTPPPKQPVRPAGPYTPPPPPGPLTKRVAELVAAAPRLSAEQAAKLRALWTPRLS